MPAIPFTQAAIAKAMKAGVRRDYSFTSGPSLELRVKASGNASWRWRGRVKALAGGKSPLVRMGLGDVATLTTGRPCPASMKAAWEAASSHDRTAANGTDPREAARAAQRAEWEAKTIGELWSDYSAPHGGLSQLGARSQHDYALTYALHVEPEWGARKASTITPQDCRRFYLAHHRKSRSAGQRLAVLSAIMREAVQQGIVERNPCKGAKEGAPKKRPGKAIVKLRKADVAALMAAAYRYSDRTGLMLEIAATTGLRRANVLSARWEWIRPPVAPGEAAFMDVPASEMKGSKSHTVALSPVLWSRLETYRGRDGVTRARGYLFPAARDPSRPVAGLGRWWSRVRKDTGLEGVRWHDLRHYVGGELARQGATAPVIKRQLAHADIATTMRYIDEASLADQAAAATLSLADDLGDALAESSSVAAFPA